MAQIRRAKVQSPTRLRRGHEDTTKLVYPAGHYGATLRNLRISAQKVRLVADQIRGEPVERAREILRFSSKRAAYYVDRVLLSALGNADAQSDGTVGAGELLVREAYADEAARMRRFKSGPMGRGRPIIKRSCHLTVVLSALEAAMEEAQAGDEEEQGAAGEAAGAAAQEEKKE